MKYAKTVLVITICMIALSCKAGDSAQEPDKLGRITAIERVVMQQASELASLRSTVEALQQEKDVAASEDSSPQVKRKKSLFGKSKKDKKSDDVAPTSF